MTAIDDTEALRAGLADSLPLISKPWKHAFRTVPRHLLVPRFARRDPIAGEFVHHDVTDPTSRQSALAAVYSDDVLVTQFDDDGAATSSSTEPSLMASMLEALDTEPGHNVLEVGTGTGYNAALLCEALGSDKVTTIDVDRHLTDTAETALADAGYHPVVVCGDGACGVPERAPFDRIIATCGVDRVPVAWLDQLAPSGAILVNVSKGIVRLRRQPDGSVSGPFLSSAGFMPLRADTDPARLVPRAVITATDGEAEHGKEVAAPGLPFRVGAFLVALVAERSQLVYLHGDDDEVTSYRWVHPESGSWARVDLAEGRATVHQSGPRRLWDEMTPVLDSWQSSGQPEIERYGLTVTPDGGHVLWLDHAEQVVTTLH